MVQFSPFIQQNFHWKINKVSCFAAGHYACPSCFITIIVLLLLVEVSHDNLAYLSKLMHFIVGKSLFKDVNKNFWMLLINLSFCPRKGIVSSVTSHFCKERKVAASTNSFNTSLCCYKFVEHIYFVGIIQSK